MLLARKINLKINLNQLKNAVISQQHKLLSLPQSSRTLSTSQILANKSENDATSRIYFGKKKLKNLFCLQSKFLILGTLTPQIRAIKVFSLTTSAVGVCSQPILYEQAAKMGSSTPVVVAICGFIGFFTFITPLLIHFVTKKYVTELHYDAATKEYIATIITFFMTKKKIRFTPDDVEVPEVPGMFTSFLVKDKATMKQMPLFVDPRVFDDPSHYVKIMGYDKPIDFKLNLESENTEKK